MVASSLCSAVNCPVKLVPLVGVYDTHGMSKCGDTCGLRENITHQSITQSPLVSENVL